MNNENPVIVAIREFFKPLVKLTLRLPPILAYILALVLALFILFILGTVIPGEWIWPIVLLVLAGLFAYIYWDLNRRKESKEKDPDTKLTDSEKGEKEALPSIITSFHLNQEELEESLNKHAVVDHNELIGVNELLVEINNYLANPNDDWMISLFGEGGVGKTALAYEIVKRYAIESKFTRFAWVSAKQRFFESSVGVQERENINLQWADLVKQIADQLGVEVGYSRTSWLDDFKNNIHKLDRKEKCLIVIDNLETVDDASVVTFFDNHENPQSRIVEPHKVIFTTRKSIYDHSKSIIEVPIYGLRPQSALELIRYLGRGNPAIMAAKNEDFQPILDVTEGNPFLIKLIIGRFLVSRKPVNLILNDLKRVNSTGIAAEVKKYLYMQSLQELDNGVGEDIASRLMNAFCPRAAGDMLTYEQLYNYSSISDKEVFEKARKLACDLSLIRASGTSLNTMYSIHSLLYEFTCKGV